MNRRTIVGALAATLLLGAGETRAADADGFLYGTVLTESGTEYKGFLRWGKQEAFWDDLFHSSKQELPFRDEVDLGKDAKDREARRGRVRVFNFKIEWQDDDAQASRIFVARFGDIARIEVTGGEDARVIMRNGETHDVSGYSDDVGGTIHVQDQTLGAIDLKWDRIESITFQAAPRGADPGVTRLFGAVETDAGRFEGFVMWDKEECTSADLLDGESDDGDLSIEMGRIRTIERRGRSSSWVELTDGRRLRLRGSNDVDDDNRGIMIEDPRFGKVTVDWESFDRLELREPDGSGRGYADYAAPTELRGRVTDAEGSTTAGRLVFDLDEASTWEMLNGRIRDVEFDVPFGMIASIEPDGSDASRVVLRNGEEFVLEDSQDVSDRNDGILVYERADAEPRYLRWDDVARIEFDR